MLLSANLVSASDIMGLDLGSFPTVPMGVSVDYAVPDSDTNCLFPSAVPDIDCDCLFPSPQLFSSFLLSVSRLRKKLPVLAV